MLKKSVLITLVVLMLFAGAVSAQETEITLLNSKGEIQAQLEDAAKAFSDANEDIEMEIIPAPAGQSPYEMAVSLYASGNAPTMSMLDPGDMGAFKEKFLNLSDQKWVEHSRKGALDAATFDGKVYAFALAIEGHSLIYNKKVVDKAVGGNFDPDSIRTREDLEQLFVNIKENTDAAPLVISPMDWSLGGHFIERIYSLQAKEMDEVIDFLDKLRAGKVNLAENDKFMGLMKTFDVMKKYNIDKNDPLSGTYDRGPELLGSGEVGIWYMGNWAWPQISEFNTSNAEYGFIPVPVSNNPKEYGNSEIIKGSSKFIGIDKAQSTEAEQEAAKKFLNWLLESETGQKLYVNEMKIIPPYTNVDLKPKDPLAKSIISYMDAGNTIEAIPVMPGDHWSHVGASMQKYLADYIEKAGLAEEIENYWENK